MSRTKSTPGKIKVTKGRWVGPDANLQNIPKTQSTLKSRRTKPVGKTKSTPPRERMPQATPKPMRIRGAHKTYRTKVPGRIKNTFANCGGNIINPPKKCGYRKVQRLSKGSRRAACFWVDVGCCIACCGGQCGFFRWWEGASTKERASWSYKNGIFNPSLTRKTVR